MKQGSNSRRTRGRGNNGKRSSNRNNSYDSGGPEGKIRGNANQIHDKYIALARDALAADDRITSENYFQHAEHFYRIMMANADGKKDPTNPSYNTEQKNGKVNTQSDDQKERSKHRRGRNNNRGGNRNNEQNADTVNTNNTENNDQETEPIKADSANSTKTIKKVSIEKPQDVLIDETVDKDKDSKEQLPA